MARYGDFDELKLKVQRYMIPNDGCGLVSIEQAERCFLKLLDEAHTADVVPKSEVERLQAELDSKQFRCDSCDRIMLTGAEHRACVKQAKAKVAREIFEEIEKRLAMYSHIHKYAEEAKQTTEEYADGTPCEMSSVWDAISLHKNGWDDYETMCQLQDNIQSIDKSRLLKEFEVDIAQLKKKYTEGET